MAVLLSPMFLGFAPVFGKLAYLGGSDPFTVAAMRTVIAAAVLWIVYSLFARQYIYIYPAGFLGCVVVGTVNGVGSLFYYNGLNALNNASVAQLLNATYLIFVVVLVRLAGHRLSRRTLLRALLALVAVMLLTGGIAGQISWLGAGLMVGNAILFAGTIILSQRVLYEMPSPTVTLYVITTMAVVVAMARAVYRLEWIPQSTEAFGAIAALGVTTALSRLTLFVGVKKLGSLQTVLLGILETAVAVLASFLFLNEALTPIQWLGVGLLLFSVLLVRPEDFRRETQEIPALNLTGTGFQHIVFNQAFGNAIRGISSDDLAAMERMLDTPSRVDKSQTSDPLPDSPPGASK